MSLFTADLLVTCGLFDVHPGQHERATFMADIKEVVCVMVVACSQSC